LNLLLNILKLEYQIFPLREARESEKSLQHSGHVRVSSLTALIINLSDSLQTRADVVSA
jgi:hypothetical protein